jgi:hypothetical protein
VLRRRIAELELAERRSEVACLFLGYFVRVSFRADFAALTPLSQ